MLRLPKKVNKALSATCKVGTCSGIEYASPTPHPPTLDMNCTGQHHTKFFPPPNILQAQYACATRSQTIISYKMQ